MKPEPREPGVEQRGGDFAFPILLPLIVLIIFLIARGG